ncbi:flagellar basal body P-ring formation chaperone FlgA [Roseivivax sp. CAU 1753]
MRVATILLSWLLAHSAMADVVVATRPIAAMEIISSNSIVLKNGTVDGAVGELDGALGREARVALYPGQPILDRHLSAPAIIERNAHVLIVFNLNGLEIVTEGRSLGRGGAGDRIRVMNLASKATLYGKIRDDGSVSVSR